MTRQLAERFAADLGQLREQVAATNAYGARGVAIQEQEVAALAKLARGERDAALALAKAAADIELTLAAPSGPPEPMKPAFELYGELLLAAGRPADAISAFEQALLRTPQRTPSLAGLGAAAVAAGDAARARRAYTAHCGDARGSGRLGRRQRGETLARREPELTAEGFDHG